MHRIILTGVLLFSGLLTSAQNVRIIVDQHLDDYGQQLWDQMATIEVEGFWIEESFQKNPVKITFKNPDKIRIDGNWQGQRFVQATNGLVAWQVVPWSGALEMTTMPVEELLFLKNLYQIGSPLARCADSLVLDGLEAIDGKLLIKLRQEDANERHLFYLGKEDLRLYEERVISKTGNGLILIKKYKKYKSHHGLLTPTSISLLCGTIKREFTLDEVTLGIGAPKTFFEWHDSP